MRPWLKFAMKLAIAVLLLLLIFSRVPLEAVLSALGQAHLSLFFAVVALSLLGVVVAAWRLGIVMRAHGRRFSVPLGARIKLITRFYGVALPGSLPVAAIHWHLLSREDGRRAETAAALAYSRLLYWLSMTILGVVFCLLDTAGPSIRQPASIVLSSAALLMAIAFLLIHGRMSLLPGVNSKLPPRLAESLTQVRDLVPRLRARQKAAVAALACLESLVAIAALLLLALALDIRVGAVTIGWVRPLIVFATTLPITPFGLGVREGGLILLLAPFGVAEASAVALSLLMLTRNLCLAGIGGLIEARRVLRLPERVAHDDP